MIANWNTSRGEHFEMSSVEVNVNRGGCLRIIVAIILIWALLFGVTWNGKHHGIHCSREKGVGVE